MTSRPRQLPARRGAGLRSRLLAVLVGVTAVALALSGIFTFTLVRRSAVALTESNLRRQIDGVTGYVDAQIADLRAAQPADCLPPSAAQPPGQRLPRCPTGAALLRRLANVLDNVERASFFWVDASGFQPLRQAGPNAAASAGAFTAGSLRPGPLLAGAVEQGRYRLAGRAFAWVAKATSETDAGGRHLVVVLQTPVENAPGLPGVRSFVLAGLIALAVAVAVSIWLAGRFTRPLRKMTDTAAAIAGGDYSKRVDFASSDEVGVLADGLNVMAEELERSRQSERTFLMSVSHDLRTPLTSIKGYAEAIADGAARGDAATKAAGVIGSEASRLERLVHDLLDLARLDAKEFRLHLEPVDLDVELHEVADGFAAQFHDAGIGFHASGTPLPPTVTDADRVGQVVGNLLVNALRYVPSGRDVHLGWGLDPSGRILISVADTGEGIAAQDLPHVFERLYVSEHYRGRRVVGTGLGLTIVAQLTRALRGDAAVASEVGIGTTFSIRLPVVPVPPTPPTPPTPHPAETPTIPAGASGYHPSQ